MPFNGYAVQGKFLLPKKSSGDVRLAKIGKSRAGGKGTFLPEAFQAALLLQKKTSRTLKSSWMKTA